MPRRPRASRPGQLQHITDRGLAQRPLFESPDEFRFFQHLLKKIFEAESCQLLLHAFVLMTNHVHLLTEGAEAELSRIMHLLFQQYAQWFNRRHDRDGPLFKQRFTSHPLDVGAPFIRITQYIDQNPVKAGMVDRPSQYPWGSAIHYHRGELPHWLCGDLVKSHLQRELSAGLSLPQAYLARFGGPMSPETYRDLEARIQRDVSTHQSCSVLPSFESPGTLDWFGERARLADGLDLLTRRLILPSELEDHLTRQIVRLGLTAEAHRPISTRLSQLRLVRTALLRQVCRLSVADTAGHLACSPSTISTHVRRHLRALQQDERYCRFFTTLLTTLESTTRSFAEEKGQSLFCDER